MDWMLVYLLYGAPSPKTIPPGISATLLGGGGGTEEAEPMLPLAWLASSWPEEKRA